MEEIKNAKFTKIEREYEISAEELKRLLGINGTITFIYDIHLGIGRPKLLKDLEPAFWIIKTVEKGED